MNFLNVFEERISSLFDTTAADVSPISFKKLAKQASKELQNETYVIDGVNTAPALFTVLINGGDNQQMAAIQADLAHETELFLEAAAKRKHYVFVGEPLVRFLVDPSLKPGKFSVFAENVDAPTLEKLRDEERGFLQELSADAAEVRSAPSSSSEPPFAPSSSSEPPQKARVRKQGPADASCPAHRVSRPAAVQTGVETGGANIPLAPPINPKSVPLAQPKRKEPLYTGASSGTSFDSEVPPEHVAMLIDRQTGQTFTCNTAECIIGRERSSGGIVLRDPNISRQHAKIVFNGRYWAIEDLKSTNGTLVNNADTQKQRLSTGDVITLGLTNLEFVEG